MYRSKDRKPVSSPTTGRRFNNLWAIATTNLQSSVLEGAMVLCQSCFVLLGFPHRWLWERFGQASLWPWLLHGDCNLLQHKTDILWKQTITHQTKCLVLPLSVYLSRINYQCYSTVLSMYGPRPTFGSRWCKESALAMESPSATTITWKTTSWWHLLSCFWRPLRRLNSNWRNHFFSFSCHKIVHVHRGWAACILFSLTKEVMGAKTLSKAPPAPPTRKRHKVGSLCWLNIFRLATVKTEDRKFISSFQNCLYFLSVLIFIWLAFFLPHSLRTSFWSRFV